MTWLIVAFVGGCARRRDVLDAEAVAELDALASVHDRQGVAR